MNPTAMYYLVWKDSDFKLDIEIEIERVINMALDFIVDMYVPLIMAACLVVGYIVKKWVKDVDNKFIPTIVCVFGLVLNLFVSGFSIVSAVAGAVTGLASTGLHQVFKQIVEGAKEEA